MKYMKYSFGLEYLYSRSRKKNRPPLTQFYQQINAEKNENGQLTRNYVFFKCVLKNIILGSRLHVEIISKYEIWNTNS